MPKALATSELPSTVEEMFCFSVYAASHAINRAYAPLLKPLGLTYPQYITLTVLWESDGLRVGDLSQRLKMESSTLTPLLKRLEKLGHIKRQRGKTDERQVYIFLTKTGLALKKAAPSITACMINDTGMDLKALRALIASLSKLTDALTSTQ